MTNKDIPKLRTSRWGTDLVHYTTPRETAMSQRFPLDYSCPLCNRRLVKPTLCFSCMHLVVRIVVALLKQPEQRYTKDIVPRHYRVTDKYVEEQHGSKILAQLEAHDRELRKQEFLERMDNPKPKAYVVQQTDFCNRCYLAIPIGLGYCEEHNYSIVLIHKRLS